MPRFAIATLVALAVSAQPAQQDQPGNSRTVLRSTTQEVLLDFIARDKHQKLLTNLRAEDIEVLEDGLPQTLRSFRYVGGRNESARRNEPLRVPTGPTPAAPLREINLVSLVFEAVGPESRREATQAAKDFLANEVDADTFVGVFTLNHRLALLQQYTNDVDILNRAVDRAMGGAYQQFAKDLEAEVAKLNRLAANPDQFQPIRPGSAEERGPTEAGAHFGPVERRMARMTLKILVDQVGSLSIDALQQLIAAQAQLPGRKTVLYFSPGLIVPPDQPERLRAVVSAANRANIAFYTVDPTGLDASSRVKTASRISQAISLADASPGARPTDFSENLRNLAEETGGFAISDTNDARVPLRHVMEEVRAHYEVSYAPTSASYDGHFRAIEVRVHKPGVRVQGRNGYFALPELNGEVLAPFEFDALTALGKQPPPHAFDFHAGVLTFRAAARQTECRAVFSVPARQLHFTGNSQLFHVHVAFLALVKDEQDQVVSKISRDLRFQAPAAKRPEFERGEATVSLPLTLPPGRYHLEAVADDVDGDAASTRKISLVVPSAGMLSDLVLARSVQPNPEDRDAMDPLEFSGGKITPEIEATVLNSNGIAAVYFVLYPGAGPSADVRIDVSQNGAVVNSVHPGLPAAEADGSVRVLSGIPFSGFGSGMYEVTVTAAQGRATARRTVVIEVQ